MQQYHASSRDEGAPFVAHSLAWLGAIPAGLLTPRIGAAPYRIRARSPRSPAADCLQPAGNANGTRTIGHRLHRRFTCPVCLASEYRKRIAGPDAAAELAAGQPTPAHAGAADRIGTIKCAAAKVRSGNEIGKQVLAYRVECWRKWLSQALIDAGAAEQSARVLFALVLAGKAGQIDTERFAKVASKIGGAECKGHSGIDAALAWAGGLDAAHFGQMQQTMIGAAAFGVEESTLVSMLDFLGVEEERFYTLDESLLTLLTKTQLTGLAKELGLNKKLPTFIALSEGKKTDFIKALLTIKDQAYAGLVPAVMKYPRPLAKKVKAERKRAAAVATASTKKADRKGKGGGVAVPHAGEGAPDDVETAGIATTGEATAPEVQATNADDLPSAEAAPVGPNAQQDAEAEHEARIDIPVAWAGDQVAAGVGRVGEALHSETSETAAGAAPTAPVKGRKATGERLRAVRSARIRGGASEAAASTPPTGVEALPA